MLHEAFGMGYTYGLFEVEPEDLPQFMERGNFHGLNVTIPYKKDVMSFCQDLSPTAREIGCINTIVRQPGGGLFGHNTDGTGFLAMLRQSGINPNGKKIAVLGDGGSSLTVCHVLKQQNAGEIITSSRRGKHNYDNISDHHDAQILVNTTPVGMYPDTGKTLVNLKDFPRLEGVLDLIYNPARTRVLMDAQSLGIPCIGGLPMLVGQAAAAAEIFSEGEVAASSAMGILRRRMENIVLVGMPGCGKTTIGRLLAEKLNRPLIDTDAEIEAAAGKSISKIFQAEGEDGFRQREIAVLQKYGKESGQIISTGGGCITRSENYFHLRQNGIVVFITRGITLLKREGRPLSQSQNLQNMYEARLPHYQRFADITIQNDTTPFEAVEKILEEINEATGN